METDNSRIRIAKKPYSPPKDTPKKKKQNKKDTDAKHPEPLDISDQKMPEPEPNVNPQLVQYVFKLRHQLLETENELKFEQNKFRRMITSIVGYFDKDKGEQSLLETLGCEKLLQDLRNHSEQEASFDKFFTTHKYQLQDKKPEITVEEDHNNDQKAKAKAAKPSKGSTSLIKINLKDMETDKPDIPLEKEPTKRPKKKKASSPVEEEKETKKKRIKKNKGTEEGSAAKEGGPSKPMLISPNEKEGGGHEDNKVKKAEDSLNKYEDLAHMKPGHDSFERRMQQQNSMFNDGLKYLAQQAKVDPGNLLNQQLLMSGLGYNPMMGGEPIDQAKLVQELLKQGIQDPVLMGMNPKQDFLNYYQRSFQS